MLKVNKTVNGNPRLIKMGEPKHCLLNRSPLDRTKVLPSKKTGGKMKELAVGYCRVSTKKQEKSGLSLDAQEDYIRNNVDGKFEAVKFFKVQESGGDSERKHLMQTFGYCVENNIKHILITDSDRWTRSREMDINAQKFIKENDLSVHILREKRLIGKFGSVAEEFAHNVLVDAGQMVKDMITEKVIAGIKQKLGKSEYPTTPPLGYKSIRKTDVKPHTIIQTEKAPKMKKLLELFNTGKFTIRQTIKLAKDIGLTPKKKNEFTKGAMAKLIKNRFYYGEFEYSLPNIDDGESKIYQNKTEGFEPIITKKVWKQNQEILKKRQTNHSGRNVNKHTFNNLITCGKCGGLVFGFQPKYKVKYKTKGGIKTKDYTYPVHYICNKNSYFTTNGKNSVWGGYVNSEDMVIKKDITYEETYTGETKIYIKKGTKVETGRCDMPYFLESEVEKMIMDEVGLIKFNKKAWEKMKANLFKDEQKEFLDFEIRSLRSEMTKNETRLDALYDDYKDEVIELDFFETRTERISNRQKEAKERLLELEEERETHDDKIGKAIRILDSFKNWERIWKEADADKKRQLVNLMTIKVSTVYHKKVYKGTTYEEKQLRITYTPEFNELFTIGLLETDKEMRKENPNYGFFNSPDFRYSSSDH